MMTDDSVGFLVQEVDDLLAAGSVGLYEFLSILRGKYPDATDAMLQTSASDALHRLLAQGNVRRIQLIWPSDDPIDGEHTRTLSPADWADPGETPYTAITRD
jgi:hypothetical protein